MINKQAKNAGNRGDILKHAVLLEILDCATRNNIWSYRESHAGAGYYELNENSKGLKTFLTESVEKMTLQEVGTLYGQYLQQWWEYEVNTYPGSVALASEILHIKSNSLNQIDIRVTEKYEDAFIQLKGLKSKFQIELKNESFDKNLDWLCKGSSMVFLVDPYFYDLDAKKESGGFGKEQLFDIFNRLSGKEAAVLIIFTSYIKRSHNKTYVDLERDIKNNLPHKSLARHFVTTQGKDGETYYRVSVIGFGAGVKIVNSLPYDWSKSWLASNDVNTLIKEFKS